MTDNTLYFGDNLHILRDNIRDETVDLIYLDPPFNSKANYNLLFQSPKGHSSDAQIEAFEDTWHWGAQAEREFAEIIHQSNTDVSEMMQSLRRFLGESDVMAYLTMIANRLLELHRVLKPTGSIYLHCDPTASHYIKLVMDVVFGPPNFRSEIIWKRTFAHSSAKRYGPVHDVIFFYTGSDEYTWNKLYQPYEPEYLETFFDHVDQDGRRWMRMDLTGDGVRHGDSGEPWRGINVTAKGRHWAIPTEAVEQYKLARNATSQQKLDALDAAGAIHWPKRESGVPRLKRYADKSLGVSLQSVWTDIRPLHNLSAERLGYPTQKPLQLLERIIQSSSNAGDVILDPFCGCGTAIHAAEKLKRKWIGIDITHLAISLIEKRLNDAFPSITFEVQGTPKDFESAHNLSHRDKYQFQWWACSLINAQPYHGKKKGADSGIDGLIFFQDDKTMPKKIIVSVKGGENVNVAMIRDLGHVVDREKASIGLFVTLVEPTRPMKDEAVAAGYYEAPTGASFPKIQILTIKGLLEGTEQPNYPDLMRGGLMFKKATREVTEEQDDLFK